MKEREPQPPVDIELLSDSYEVAHAQRKLASLAIPDSAPWYKQALCAYSTTDVFIRDTPSQYDVRLATSFCGSCKVSDRCLQEGLDTNDNHTIRAGLVPDKRRSLKRRTHSASLPGRRV